MEFLPDDSRGCLSMESSNTASVTNMYHKYFADTEHSDAADFITMLTVAIDEYLAKDLTDVSRKAYGIFFGAPETFESFAVSLVAFAKAIEGHVSQGVYTVVLKAWRVFYGEAGDLDDFATELAAVTTAQVYAKLGLCAFARGLTESRVHVPDTLRDEMDGMMDT